MGEKGRGWFPQFLLSSSSLHPPLNMPRNRLPRSTPGLTCHFQGLQICQAGQGAIADGVDHGAWGRGGPNSEPVKATISIPSSPLFFSVPSPMPSPSPLSPPPPPPRVRCNPSSCSSATCIHFITPLPHPALGAHPAPGPGPLHRRPGRRAPCGTQKVYRRVQATAARIVSLQLAEIHAAAAAATSGRNKVCKERSLRAFSAGPEAVLALDQSPRKTRPKRSRRRCRLRSTRRRRCRAASWEL